MKAFILHGEHYDGPEAITCFNQRPTAGEMIQEFERCQSIQLTTEDAQQLADGVEVAIDERFYLLTEFAGIDPRQQSAPLPALIKAQSSLVSKLHLQCTRTNDPLAPVDKKYKAEYIRLKAYETALETLKENDCEDE